MNDCAICLEKIENEEKKLQCKHSFHLSCITEWKNNTCPLCRAIIVPEFINPIIPFSRTCLYCLQDSYKPTSIYPFCDSTCRDLYVKNELGIGEDDDRFDMEYQLITPS